MGLKLIEGGKVLMYDKKTSNYDELEFYGMINKMGFLYSFDSPLAFYNILYKTVGNFVIIPKSVIFLTIFKKVVCKKYVKILKISYFLPLPHKVTISLSLVCKLSIEVHCIIKTQKKI